jgi:AraC-like DNA-binding protein
MTPPQKNRFLQELQNAIQPLVFSEEFSIDELCRQMGISRMHLHRKLIDSTGLSASHYINLVRLQKAKELLVMSDLTVSEVAYEVGFRDPNYFTRVFVEKNDVSPTCYRKAFFELRYNNPEDRYNGANA